MTIVLILLLFVAVFVLVGRNRMRPEVYKDKFYLTQITAYGGPNDSGQKGTTNVNNNIVKGKFFNDRYPKNMRIVGGKEVEVWPVAINCQYWHTLGGKVLEIKTAPNITIYGHANNICPKDGGVCQEYPMNLDVWYKGVNRLFPYKQHSKNYNKTYWYSKTKPKNGYPRFRVVGKSLDEFDWNLPGDKEYKACKR